MKKILKNSLIFALFAGLALSNFNAWFLPFAKADFSSPAPVAAGQKVTVVNSASIKATKIRVSGNPVLATSCRSAVAVSGSLALGAAAVNLNEPADCFSLSLGSAQSFANLQVKDLAAAPQQIIVKVARAQIASPYLAPMPFAQSNPVLPLSLFVIVIAYELWDKKAAPQFSLQPKQQIKFTLGLSQLVLLRC